MSTGLAPDGRLYSGDLNAMEDQYADLNNLAQAVGVGSLAVGESGLQLVRYGAGEARITGAVRTDGILRALGGFYAGAFTTTQRDAIAAGSRPYGLVILNTTSNRLEINLGSDATPSWSGLNAAISRGTLGTRPGATSSNANNLYFATDDNGGTLYYSDGSAWTKVAPGLTQAPPDGSVTTAKLASDVAVIPVGGVIDWPWQSSTIPAWSALSYGQGLAQASYPALAVAAGVGAGGTVTLPDYRGRIGVGKDDMGGTAANRITAAISGVNGTTLGAVFGAEGITLTTAQLPAHNHTAGTLQVGSHYHGGATGGRSADHTHGITWGNLDADGGIVAGGSGAAGTMGSNGESNDHTHGIAAEAPGVNGSTANAGSGSAHQNTQPSIIVNKIMRVV